MKELNLDFSHTLKYFIGVIVVITIIGLICLYSSSYMYARDNFSSSYYLISKQLISLAMGIIGAFIISKTRFTFWYHNSLKFHLLTSLLVLLTFIPKIGLSIKGSHRWVNLRFMSIQPGEFLKFSVLLTALYFFENYKNFSKDTKIIYLLSILAPLGLTVLQPDFGTFTLCFSLIFFLAFLSKVPRSYLIGSLAVGSVAFVALLVAAPYRVKRLMSFLDPWADPQNSGFQIIQSYLAFAEGSLFGKGLGASVEKLFYLPEAYNDFILSVIGEELGFVGVAVIATLFLIFLYLGFKLASQSKVNAGKIFIAGYTFLISLQAFLNMGIVLGLLPTKGLNLPFVSYGGSSLLCNLIGLGLIISLQRYQQGANSEKEFLYKENTQLRKYSTKVA